MLNYVLSIWRKYVGTKRTRIEVALIIIAFEHEVAKQPRSSNESI